MLFSTPAFMFFFLPAALFLYFLIPSCGYVRNLTLLVISMAFFAWGEPIFVFVLFGLVSVDYFVSRAISPQSGIDRRVRQALLCGTVIASICLLAWAKYTDFLMNSILAPLLGRSDLVIAPISAPLILGISFITFHRISFLVDSFNGRASPPRNILDAALYIFLFPQLIAGPIIRFFDISEQIRHRTCSPELFLSGFFRFMVGMSKKLLIADQLGIAVDRVFNQPPSSLSCGAAWLGTLAYTIQIYFDFSGYSDMALGLGAIFGFKFPENFNFPYRSTSITEFWRRWHISLSNWMRVYLYIPLGGNRVSKLRLHVNLWVVFLTSGLWHGANWTFIVWGAYHGAFLSIERLMSDAGVRVPIPQWCSRLLTFIAVTVGWVLFRSRDLAYAFSYLRRMLDPTASFLSPTMTVFALFDRITLTILVCTIPLVVIPVRFPALPYLGGVGRSMSTVAFSTTFATCIVLVVICAMAIASLSYSPFIYFRF